MEALAGVAIAMGVIYGGYRTIEMSATPGEFFSFITAFLLAYEPAKRLARLNIELNAGLVGVRQLFDIIDAPSSEPADDDKPKLVMRAGAGRVQGRVLLLSRERAGAARAVARRRGRADDALWSAHRAAASPPSSTPSCGSTSRNPARSLIDGQNIANVSRHSLRQQIAYVGQDVFLFHGTIRDNIAFGKDDATDDEIIAAAKAANAHDFIMSFPNGYDTHTGEQGLQLSGGQRQRIAVARALIRDAKLILLDEATAALDSESERLVQDAIAHLTQGRTTIVIAHRLHTVAHADRIFVIEEGVVAESGRHEELLRKSGRYASFYRLQLQSQEFEPADHRRAP